MSRGSKSHLRHHEAQIQRQSHGERAVVTDGAMGVTVTMMPVRVTVSMDMATMIVSTRVIMVMVIMIIMVMIVVTNVIVGGGRLRPARLTSALSAERIAAGLGKIRRR